MTVLQNPEKSYIRSIQSFFNDFIWDSKPDKARNPIIQNYPDGGLKMVDIESYMHSLKATWVKLFNFFNSVISQPYKRQIKHHGGDLIFRCYFSFSNQQTVSSKYLTKVIQAWV